ncbi:hypothetical protein D3C87_1580870 [compost metagenome]
MHQLIEKQCAVLTEGLVNLLRFRRQFVDRGLLGQAAPQPDLTARQQQNRRAAQRHAGALVARSQAGPDQLAAATQIIQPARRIPFDPRWQNVAVPGRSRGRVAFELSDNRRQHRAALALGRRGQMLPVKQKAHEVLQRYRLDFPP